MEITKQDIEKLAVLSKIKLIDGQAEILKEKLESVINYASVITKISQHINSLEMPYNVNVMREDVIKSTDPEPILAQAPDTANHFIVVPKIIKSE